MRVLSWLAGRSIRNALTAVDDGHPLRRAYGLARRSGVLQGAWRRFFASSGHDLFDVQAYAAAGGQFREPCAHGDPPPLTGDLEADLSALVARAVALERPYEPAPGRVLVINCGLAAGGAERQIVNTVLGLAAEGVDVAFVGEYLGRAPGLDFHAPALSAGRADFAQTSRSATPGLRLYAEVTRPVAEALAPLPHDVRLEILDMVAELRRRRPQVVHLWQDQTSVKHGLAALIAGAPRIVLSGRNINPTHFGYDTPWLRPGYRALASRSEVSFTNNSQAGARSYAEWLDIVEGRIAVLRNGLDFTTHVRLSRVEAQRFRASVGASDGVRLVGGVMRLSAEKRPLLWLEAAAELARRRDDVRFVIAGDGPMAPQCRAAVAKLGLDGWVTFLGETPQADLVLGSVDLLLLTSQFEGTPNVLLEAQWLGAPVLCADAGGALETFEPGVGGDVIEHLNPARIATQMERMLDDPAWRERAARLAPAFVERRFGLARMIGETLEAYGLHSLGPHT